MLIRVSVSCVYMFWYFNNSVLWIRLYNHKNREKIWSLNGMWLFVSCVCRKKFVIINKSIFFPVFYRIITLFSLRSIHKSKICNKCLLIHLSIKLITELGITCRLNITMELECDHRLWLHRSHTWTRTMGLRESTHSTTRSHTRFRLLYRWVICSFIRIYM